jgi:hypothetical protein
MAALVLPRQIHRHQPHGSAGPGHSFHLFPSRARRSVPVARVADHVDHFRGWEGGKDRIYISLGVQRLIAPAWLAQSLRVVILQQGEKTAVGPLALPELPPDSFWVWLENPQALITHHHSQAVLEVLAGTQVTVAIVEVGP